MFQERKEIEVTPEMVEAGFLILSQSGIADDLLEADKCTVAEMYRAMVEARAPLEEPDRPLST
jgi:hypothetical protein